MANPFQQMAQQRKLVYTVLILALFTVSLLHRKLMIEPEAFNLQLRELARGEVELTSSAVRLTLTGSRGLAVTFLWSAAIKKQEKHDWNEVELLVSSITKLQPYFITPWLFQSWNLAFNVSVECDRPIDKYYYVSRGMELLAEGERRNQGGEAGSTSSRFPGNPDMRHHMGMTYQLKIGSSDEKYTMRSLLDLSCIDPVQRDPDRFLKVGAKGTQVDYRELENFCRNHPRLVRRLHEHLRMQSEKQVIKFLAATREIPSRFEKPEVRDQTQSKLKDVRDQFPILPRREADWPDPTSYDLTGEPTTVYLMSRTWFQYAQKPLPSPVKQAKYLDFNPQVHRIPRQMAMAIFREYPCRAQSFIAENLEEEGWFDSEGWTVPDWFDNQERQTDEAAPPVVVGQETKNHPGPVWNKAYQMYLEYGAENGIHLTENDRQELEAQAKPFREKHNNLAPNVSIELRSDQMDKGYNAHETLRWSQHYRNMTNFDAHLYQAEAERDPQAVLAHKIFFQAEKARRTASPATALRLYEQAIPLWMDVLLQYPNYAKVSSNQEDTYEVELKYLRHKQREKPEDFKKIAMGMWQAFQWPYVPLAGSVLAVSRQKEEDFVSQENDKAQKILVQWPFIPWEEYLARKEINKIIPIRTVRGPFDMTQYYDGADASQVKEALLLWTEGAKLGPHLVLPMQKNLLLTRAPLGERTAPPGWRYLIGEDTVRVVRDRMGLDREK